MVVAGVQCIHAGTSTGDNHPGSAFRITGDERTREALGLCEGRPCVGDVLGATL